MSAFKYHKGCICCETYRTMYTVCCQLLDLENFGKADMMLLLTFMSVWMSKVSLIYIYTNILNYYVPFD